MPGREAGATCGFYSGPCACQELPATHAQHEFQNAHHCAGDENHEAHSWNDSGEAVTP